jgi:two-component sensor histidine kinase
MDNGSCIPEDFDFKNAWAMGLKLVTLLSENQLNGKVKSMTREGPKQEDHE